MSQCKSILVFGADSMLLYTRCQVLEAAGFSVAMATTLTNMEHSLKEQKIALLLLCHSLCSDDCQQAIAIAHGFNPNIVTLSLAAMAGGTCTEKSDIVVHQMSDPQKLVERSRTFFISAYFRARDD